LEIEVANAHLLTDILLKDLDHRLRPVYAAAERTTRAPGRPGLLLDFDVASNRTNLEQAIITRLLTPRGELAPLGHPEYGSRLHELIGRENNDTTRNLMKLFILEALQLEPRIQSKADVTVTPAETRPPAPGKGARNVTLVSRVNVEIVVRPVGETDTVTIGPFTLELQP
jgi:phage baseplate assembly protein W